MLLQMCISPSPNKIYLMYLVMEHISLNSSQMEIFYSKTLQSQNRDLYYSSSYTFLLFPSSCFFYFFFPFLHFLLYFTIAFTFFVLSLTSSTFTLNFLMIRQIISGFHLYITLQVYMQVIRTYMCVVYKAVVVVVQLYI